MIELKSNKEIDCSRETNLLGDGTKKHFLQVSVRERALYRTYLNSGCSISFFTLFHFVADEVQSVLAEIEIFFVAIERVFQTQPGRGKTTRR